MHPKIPPRTTGKRGGGHAAARSAVLVLVLTMGASPAQAGPWTRPAGSSFVSLGYARIAATQRYGADFSRQPIPAFTQHLATLYAEVGLVDRWLTASLDGVLARHASAAGVSTVGLGDFRVGVASGLLVRPVRLTASLFLGFPTGDARPDGGPGLAGAIARQLPLGDGEVDAEWRLGLGWSFGGKRRWPLVHALAVEAGYWLRLGFADAFTWRVELGTRLPFRVVDRLWLGLRLSGVESFVKGALPESAVTLNGLGDGVSYVSPGFTLYGRVHRGLGISVGLDTAVRGRALPAAAQLFVGVSLAR